MSGYTHVRNGVNRAIPTVRRRLLVYPDKETISEPVGMFQTCQRRHGRL